MLHTQTQIYAKLGCTAYPLQASSSLVWTEDLSHRKSQVKEQVSNSFISRQNQVGLLVLL